MVQAMKTSCHLALSEPHLKVLRCFFQDKYPSGIRTLAGLVKESNFTVDTITTDILPDLIMMDMVHVTDGGSYAANLFQTWVSLKDVHPGLFDQWTPPECLLIIPLMAKPRRSSADLADLSFPA